MIVFFALLPFFFAFVIYKHMDDIDYPSIKKKIGSMYSGCKTNSTLALAYSFIFLIRRLIFVALTFTLIEYPQI